MKAHFLNRVITAGLAIFAMLFGSGNLMLPWKVGQLTGGNVIFGLIGFILTGVLLPLLGLLTIVAFNGDYHAFFGRLGKIPSILIIFYCMLAIGPLIIMPRIVGFSYTMLAPFLPAMPVWIFAGIFLTLVFLATYKPSRLLTIIGRILSPLKVASISAMLFIGFLAVASWPAITMPKLDAFLQGARYGYGTLDLLGCIFFGSIIVMLLKRDEQAEAADKKAGQTVKTATYAGFIGSSLIGLMYAGMTLLGALHGSGLEHLNEGELFSAISFKLLGSYGAALVGIMVFLACFTTLVSLSAVVTEYVRRDLAHSHLSYIQALLVVLGICMIPASFGLSALMKCTLPIIIASYPVFIAITVCNALYKLFGMQTIKVPVATTILIVVLSLW